MTQSWNIIESVHFEEFLGTSKNANLAENGTFPEKIVLGCFQAKIMLELLEKKLDKNNESILKYDRKCQLWGFWGFWGFLALLADLAENGIFPKKFFGHFQAFIMLQLLEKKLDKTNDSIFFKTQKTLNLDTFSGKSGKPEFSRTIRLRHFCPFMEP